MVLCPPPPPPPGQLILGTDITDDATLLLWQITMPKFNCYAVHGQRIVPSWAECLQLTKNVDAVFKGFIDTKQAEYFMQIKDPHTALKWAQEQEQDRRRKPKKPLQVYKRKTAGAEITGSGSDDGDPNAYPSANPNSNYNPAAPPSDGRASRAKDKAIKREKVAAAVETTTSTSTYNDIRAAEYEHITGLTEDEAFARDIEETELRVGQGTCAPVPVRASKRISKPPKTPKQVQFQLQDDALYPDWEPTKHDQLFVKDIITATRTRLLQISVQEGNLLAYRRTDDYNERLTYEERDEEIKDLAHVLTVKAKLIQRASQANILEGIVTARNAKGLRAKYVAATEQQDSGVWTEVDRICGLYRGESNQNRQEVLELTEKVDRLEGLLRKERSTQKKYKESTCCVNCIAVLAVPGVQPHGTHPSICETCAWSHFGIPDGYSDDEHRLSVPPPAQEGWDFSRVNPANRLLKEDHLQQFYEGVAQEIHLENLGLGLSATPTEDELVALDDSGLTKELTEAQQDAIVREWQRVADVKIQEIEASAAQLAIDTIVERQAQEASAAPSPTPPNAAAAFQTGKSTTTTVKKQKQRKKKKVLRATAASFFAYTGDEHESSSSTTTTN
jgi:hypothetical protein